MNELWFLRASRACEVKIFLQSVASLSVCRSLCLSVTLCLSLSLSVCHSLCLLLSVCLSAALSVCLSLSLCLLLSVCLSAALSVCCSLCLSLCHSLSACCSLFLPVSLSVCRALSPPSKKEYSMIQLLHGALQNLAKCILQIFFQPGQTQQLKHQEHRNWIYLSFREHSGPSLHDVLDCRALLDNFHSSIGERLLHFLTNDLLIVFLLYFLQQI